MPGSRFEHGVWLSVQSGYARPVGPPPLPHQLDVLQTVLERLESWEGNRSPAIVFDLDATLFDNRPRTLEILME